MSNVQRQSQPATEATDPMLVLSPCLLVAGVEDGPSSVLEMLRKRPQSRTKYTQSSPVSRGWWPHQQHEVKISTQCIYTMNVSTKFIY